MAKRVHSQYVSGARTDDWLKIKTSKRQEVVIAGFTAPRRTRPCFGALVLAVRAGREWRFIGHVGAGFSHETLKELHAKLIKLKMAKSPFPKKARGEAVTTWVKPTLVAEVKFTEWTTKCAIRSIWDSEPTSTRKRSCARAKRLVSKSLLIGVSLYAVVGSLWFQNGSRDRLPDKIREDYISVTTFPVYHCKIRFG